jgi:predicted ATPase
MSTYILDALEVDNFRGFRHLRVNKLGRVNLIVGRNNVGKTSLLEALSVYARRGSASFIWDLLEARDESSRIRTVNRNVTDTLARVEDVRYLFYGRRDVRNNHETIRIGSGTANNTLSVSTGWYALQVDDQGLRRLQPLLSPEFASVDNLVLGLSVRFGGELDTVYRLDRAADVRRPPQPELEGVKHIFVSAIGIDDDAMGVYWDNITLTNLQQQVIDSLKIIEPKLEGLNFISDSDRRHERVPVIRTSEFDGRLPLRSLGEGMSRMLGISLALSNTANGILLIDEIESGLHYSVQPDMWRIVLRMAHELNVQVFATTHSWDCIESFQKITQEWKQEKGVLIRLGRKKDDIVATVYDENDLAIVTRDQIEIR